MRRASILLLLALVCATPAGAQIPGLDQIFGGVRDVNTSLGWARPISGNDLDFKRVSAINFEITLAAGHFPKKPPATPDQGAPSGGVRGASVCTSPVTPANHDSSTTKQDSSKAKHAASSGDSTRQTCQFSRRELRIDYGVQRQLDSTVTYFFDTDTAKKAPETTDTSFHPLWEFEIGLSYGQLRGFHSKIPATPFSGTMTTLPLISTYAIWRPDRSVSPYLGAAAGLVKLDGATGTVAGDTTDLFAGVGSTYSAGFLVGVTGEVANTIYIFGEVDFTYLTFPSVQWSSIGSKTTSLRLPAAFRANSRTIWVGAQIHLKASKESTKGSGKS